MSSILCDFAWETQMRSFPSGARCGLFALLCFAIALPSVAWTDGPARQLTRVDPDHRETDRGGNPFPVVHPYVYGAVPSFLTPFGDGVMFVAGDGEHGVELWISDGSEDGTHVLTTVCSDKCRDEWSLVPIGTLARKEGPLAFFFVGPLKEQELWVTDGAPAGTRKLADVESLVVNYRSSDPWFCEGNFSYHFFEPRGELLSIQLGDRLVFEAWDPNTRQGALFTSDGTTAGTRLLAEVGFVDENQTPPDFVLAADGRHAYFRSSVRLWITDGTTAGTREVSPGCDSVGLQAVVAFGPGVALSGTCDDEPGLWVHAGAAQQPAVLAGAVLLRDLAVVGGHIYGLLGDYPKPSELWTSDGTPGGTRRVRDLGWYADALAAGGDRLYVRRNDPFVSGLYRTDGASAPEAIDEAGETFPRLPFLTLGDRTLWWSLASSGSASFEWHLVSDSPIDGLRVEQRFSTPKRGYDHENLLPRFRVAGERLYLATDGGDGYQLWGMNLAELGGSCFDAAGAQCLRDGRFEVKVEFHNQHNGGTAGTATPDAATRAAAGDTGYFWFFRPDNLELAVKVLDGRPVDGHWWVFAGGTTDLEYDLTVYDHVRGEERSYHHAAGDLCAVVDTAAFAEVASAGATRASGAAGSPPRSSPSRRAPRRAWRPPPPAATRSRASTSASAPATASRSASPTRTSTPAAPCAPACSAPRRRTPRRCASSPTAASRPWSRCSTGGRSTATGGCCGAA